MCSTITTSIDKSDIPFSLAVDVCQRLRLFTRGGKCVLLKAISHLCKWQLSEADQPIQPLMKNQSAAKNQMEIQLAVS